MECVRLCAQQHLLNGGLLYALQGSCGKGSLMLPSPFPKCSWRTNCWTDCGASSILSGHSEIDFINISCIPGGLMRTRWALRRIDSSLALLQNLITLILQKFICILQCWCREMRSSSLNKVTYLWLMTNTAGSGPAPLLYKCNFVQIVTFLCNRWMYYFDHLTKRAEAGN